ncbi:MAG: hypothetical protein AB8B61_07560 [Cyclobacteriaceae bacterium]
MKKILVAASTLLVLIVGAALFNSCQREDDTDPNYVPSGQELVLGEGEIAYTVENMQRALDSAQAALSSSFPGARLMTEELTIQVNNKYVRFLPKDTAEYDLLMDDSTMNLFNYPIDKPILQNGTEYVPEFTNANGYSWLYGVVPLDKELPSAIETELIEEVFIPELGNSSEGGLTSGRVANVEGEASGETDDVALYAAVEAYALYLSGQMGDVEANEMIAAYSGGNVESQGGSLRINSDGKLESEKMNSFIKALKSVKMSLNMFITPAFAGGSSGGSSGGSKICLGCIVNKNWRPEGTIFVEDNTMTPSRVPLRGIKVSVHRHLRSRAMYTNDNGYFKSDKDFGSKSYYTVKFRSRKSRRFGRKFFRIIENFPFTAKHRISGKTNKRVDYTYRIDGRPDNKNEAIVMVYLAAQHYYHRDILGLNRPPRKMRIRVRDEDNSDNTNGAHSTPYFLLSSQIDMKLRDRNGGYRLGQDLMGTTFHEIAHSTHYSIIKERKWLDINALTFSDIDKIVKESWASGVQVELNRFYFPNYDRGSYSSTYTSVVRDLIDGGVDNSSTDRVSGYTISEIEKTLKNVDTWQGWEDEIRNKYNNDTENELSNLFNSL